MEYITFSMLSEVTNGACSNSKALKVEQGLFYMPCVFRRLVRGISRRFSKSSFTFSNN